MLLKIPYVRDGVLFFPLIAKVVSRTLFGLHGVSDRKNSNPGLVI